jgi:hypothetical protein
MTYRFIQVSVSGDKAQELIKALADGYHIISAVSVSDAVQYILERNT